MTTRTEQHTVAGKSFTVYSDIILRGTFATNDQTGEVKQIKSSGYLSNELSIRKAIAQAFKLDTFRKN